MSEVTLRSALVAAILNGGWANEGEAAHHADSIIEAGVFSALESKLTRISEHIDNAIGQAEEWGWIPERGDIMYELITARAILSEGSTHD